MKLFVIKATIFCALVAAIFCAISFSFDVDPDKGNSFVSAIVDKHKRLDETKENRLILVGGSNLPFGIDSKKIEEELHFKVTNLGLLAGFGRDFILNEAISVVKPNDVIVLSLEYELYDPANVPGAALIERAQYAFPEAKSYYTFSPTMYLHLAYDHFRKSFNFSHRWLEPDKPNAVYSRDAINAYGDVFIDRPASIVNGFDLEKNVLTRMQSLGDVQIFRDLSEKCKQVGAKVFIVFPNYPKKMYEKNKDAIDDTYSLIQKEIPFIPVLGTPETFLGDDPDFFDTIYHLTTPAAARRTEALVALLKQNGIVAPDSGL
ncbi:MAG TPA: hypothetical protein VFE50_05070 [Cyclobacteriaceae bacterium]|nr:hypothetical protein [Cyclobacteriaceae bacterium]